MDTNVIRLQEGPTAQGPSVGDFSRHAPRAHDIARPAPRRGLGPRGGWMLSTVVAVVAAWALGWVTGVSRAWRQITWH
jgi:hypothetical protein